MTLTPAEDAEKDMRNEMINKEKNVRHARFMIAVVACAAAVGATINIFNSSKRPDHL
jgi:hypothetical protein